VDGPFVVEKAVRPVDGKVTWLVLDDDLDPVAPVTQFSLYLDGGGVARFLNWCQRQGLDWSNISLPQLILYKRTLEAEATPAGRPRSGKPSMRTSRQ
jgi:hypothetical protein